MAETGTAKLFKHGRGQAVRLPEGFHLPGTVVGIRRFGRGVLLEPIQPVARSESEIKAIFAELDRLGAWDFLPDGRQQPSMPPPDDASLDD